MKIILLVFVSGVFSSSIYASATANEFSSCKKKAAFEMAQCPDSKTEECIAKSKEKREACYQRIIERHGLKPARIQAKKDKKEQAPR
ncbi:hypothetical protein [Alteromonas sp. C1M14]|uniref:hypothetical protein n=1 Tax=Alteromonas sp. C1M14 TaxID=2841567 RepID=UPI001C085F34|nr:hypothetical protein [Alteromonas sp. C1M14]MBU2978740.1 hypothetical protein [Alteromonas sp. C1M14]